MKTVLSLFFGCFLIINIVVLWFNTINVDSFVWSLLSEVVAIALLVMLIAEEFTGSKNE